MLNRPFGRSFNGVRLASLLLALFAVSISTQQIVAGQSRRVPPDNRRQLIAAKSMLRIENMRGNIQVLLSNRADIEIETTRRSSSQLLSPGELTVLQTDAQAIIRVALAENNLANGIDLKILAPINTGLRLVSETGNIEISGAAASLMARTTRGNIELNLPERANIDLDLISDDGSIQLGQDLKFYGSYNGSAMYGRIGDGGPIYTAHSLRGQIRLKNALDNEVSRKTNPANNSTTASSGNAARNSSSSTNSPGSLSRRTGQGASSANSANRGNDEISARPIPEGEVDNLPPRPPVARPANNGQPQAAAIDTGEPVLREPEPRAADNGSADTGSRPPVLKSPVKPELKRPETVTGPVVTGPAVAEKDDNLGDDNVLRIESQLVTLNASVSTRNGKPIPDLKKEDFKLYEDKVEQEIVHFQSAQTPFNLVLLIDLSGSLREKLPLIRRAAWRFIQATRPEDKVAVVTFTSRTRVASPLTGDREELRRRIEKINKPDGGTNFYDAMEDTLYRVLAPVKGQRNAIVVLTDGVDNALPGIPGSGSEISFEDMLDHIMETDTLVFPIYIDTEQEAIEEVGDGVTRGYAIARKQLKELSDATGGAIYYAQRVEDLEGRYEEVAAELRTVYSLGYYPSNSEASESFHRINVRVGRDGAQVRTRRGYYSKRP